MLEITNLEMSYGGISALNGVSLAVAAGEMIALVGPNGAGKTSLLNTVCGFYRARRGGVRLEGADITGWPAHRIARAGLIQVPEGRQMLGPMTVAENLDLGRHACGTRTPFPRDRVLELFPILAERRDQLAGSLSGGQQQMLAIGRAMMANPRVLLLDEPSLGLAPMVATEVFRALGNLTRDGLTILIVEQNARRAFAATSTAHVMEKGTIVHSGHSADLAKDPIIVAHYLGTS